MEARSKWSTLKDLEMEYTQKYLGRGYFSPKQTANWTPNAEIDLVLFLPNSTEELHVKGRVVRVMTGNPKDPSTQLYGVGIRFLR
ncbi:MAG: PilZ domain-containing protein [Bdellovibrionota bacterium]